MALVGAEWKKLTEEQKIPYETLPPPLPPPFPPNGSLVVHVVLVLTSMLTTVFGYQYNHTTSCSNTPANWVDNTYGIDCAAMKANSYCEKLMLYQWQNVEVVVEHIRNCLYMQQ